MKTPEQLKGTIRSMAAKRNLRAQEVLHMFLFERILERLANSKYKKNFILKGGLLISSMIGISERTTMDMDTTVRGIQMEEDAYNNFRVHLRAKYGKIDTPMKIDVTTGDAITPAAVQYDFPMLFEDKTVPVMAYTLETVLAEKYETIIRRNISTTRARDFYDLHTLYRSRKSEVRIDVFRASVLHTAQKRESVEDIKDWKDILKDLREEQQMYLLWDNYLSENRYIGNLEFHVVLDTLEDVAEVSNF